MGVDAYECACVIGVEDGNALVYSFCLVLDVLHEGRVMLTSDERTDVIGSDREEAVGGGDDSTSYDM